MGPSYLIHQNHSFVHNSPDGKKEEEENQSWTKMNMMGFFLVGSRTSHSVLIRHFVILGREIDSKFLRNNDLIHRLLILAPSQICSIINHERCTPPLYPSQMWVCSGIKIKKKYIYIYILILFKLDENYKEQPISPLIKETKQGGQLSKSKKPKTLQLRDHLTSVWAAKFASLETNKT